MTNGNPSTYASRLPLWEYEPPISLIPIQKEKSELSLVHGAVAGLLATDPRNSFTCSVMDVAPDGTSLTSMVAPLTAKL